jgi:hypothetical protein
MTEQVNENHNASVENTLKGHSPEKKPSRTLLPFFFVFLVFITIIFLTQRKTTISWIENYQDGIELAKKQNKPVLVAFYKSYISTNTLERIYTNRYVKKYIEARFIPILVDADKQPEIAKLYNVNSFPAHYIKQPEGNVIFGPIASPPPNDFVAELKVLMDNMGLPKE